MATCGGICGHIGVYGAIQGYMGIYRVYVDMCGYMATYRGIWGHLGVHGGMRYMRTYRGIWGHIRVMGTCRGIWEHTGVWGYIGVNRDISEDPLSSASAKGFSLLGHVHHSIEVRVYDVLLGHTVLTVLPTIVTLD